MKLRNKKTGKIAEAIDLVNADEIWGTAKTPSEIFEDWEYYEEPAEPLIKDEKIRKAVRAWAEACGAKQIKYSVTLNQYYDADMGTGFSIKFLTKPVEAYLEEGKLYTIAELCGEEEE